MMAGGTLIFVGRLLAPEQEPPGGRSAYDGMFITVDTSITIQAPAELVWDYACNPDHWTASNPEEHFGLTFDTPDNQPAEGARFHQRESVAGVYSDLFGRFHHMDRPHLAVWSGTATYRKLGGLIKARIPEWGVLKLEPGEGGVRLSHNVYLDFPNSAWGRFLAWQCERATVARRYSIIPTRNWCISSGCLHPRSESR